MNYGYGEWPRWEFYQEIVILSLSLGCVGICSLLLAIFMPKWGIRNGPFAGAIAFAVGACGIVSLSLLTVHILRRLFLAILAIQSRRWGAEEQACQLEGLFRDSWLLGLTIAVFGTGLLIGVSFRVLSIPTHRSVARERATANTAAHIANHPIT